MKPLFPLVLVGLLAGPLSDLPAADKSGKAAVEPFGEAHVYKRVGERELRLYVIKPSDWKATDHRPAMVFFHGGGWVGGTPVQFN